MNNYPWLKHYPDMVNHEIDPDKYTSLIDFYEDCIEKYKDLPGYSNMGKVMTFKEVDEAATNFAAFIQYHTQLKPGDRIAIQIPNLLQVPVAIFGALKAGLVIVNTNPLYTEHEMKHQFNDSGAKALVILANFADKLERILPETGIETVIITQIGDMLGGLKGTITDFVVKYIKKMVPKYHIANAISFKTVLKDGKLHTWTKPDKKGSDIGFLQYTGGTTGVSKGAALTHRNLYSNMEQSYEWFKPVLKERQEIVITALPLYHIFAFTCNLMLMLKYGAKNILVTNPKDMKSFIKDLKSNKFTLITGVNTLYNALMNQEDFKSIDFSTLKVAVGGGMAVQKSVAERWKKLTGVSIAEGYGLTETSPVLCCNLVDGRIKIGSIGLPFPSTEIKLIDDDGNDVGINQPGELVAKGPQIMLGYWNRPEETAKVFENGWFKTGDIAEMNEEGFFKIVDRKKEMILVSGFNVYPSEVEDTIAMHPKVLEVGVKGVPDEHTNEAVEAFIVKKDPSLTAEEIREHCKKFLTNYKVPKHIEFRDELPKSNVGKILRRLLK